MVPGKLINPKFSIVFLSKDERLISFVGSSFKVLITDTGPFTSTESGVRIISVANP